jgi:hypothetical protein
VKSFQVNLVEREVKKFQQKFNQLFGERIVCNLQIRYSLILSICWLGVLGKRIMESKDKEKSRDLMKEFIKVKGSLRRFFDKVESSYGDERREKNANAINQTIRQEAHQHASSGA